MKKLDRACLARIIMGGVLGLVASVALVPYLTNARSPSLAACLLCTALGATLGAATLPFADDGPTLIRRSLLHLGATALEVALVLWLCVDLRDGRAWALWMGMLVLFYAVIWLGRWIGWYVEVMQLRALLGLAPGPSPLKWRETLPYLPLVLLLCDVLPPVLNWIDHAAVADVPVLSGLLLPYLMLPVAGFCSGLSLGKRQGVCPLYPVACFVCYLPMVYLVYNYTALFHCFMIAVPALAGNMLGWAYRRAVPKEGRGTV
jgi:hypothetical protein